MAENRHFTLIVAGDNPEELLKKYDDHEVEPYIVYEFNKRKEYYDNTIKSYQAIVNNKDKFSSDYRKTIKEYLDAIKDLTPEEYYIEIASDYDIDENKNAISSENPHKKFDISRIGKNLSLPLINIKGEEVFSELKENIDWSKIHLNNRHTYEMAWDLVMEGKVPTTEEERQIYENMKNRTAYFQAYKDRETYILSNIAFWGYAFLDENGWEELIDDDQFSWVINFYERFIKPLSDNTKISVYECVRYEIF